MLGWKINLNSQFVFYSDTFELRKVWYKMNKENFVSRATMLSFVFLIRKANGPSHKLRAEVHKSEQQASWIEFSNNLCERPILLVSAYNLICIIPWNEF